jgi:uncharacterized protein YndB with AHSA1/START domain
MPRQKDLKRRIRSRMQKTGEAYTAARRQLLEKNDAASHYAATAGMSDASVRKATGRNWAQWVETLDSAGAAEKPHREIARCVSSLGAPDWWSQMVAVGYERIRGLRERGQRRGGGYSATRSRTFPVAVEVLFGAFANTRQRRRWLPSKVTVRRATPPRSMRLTWIDGSAVLVGFTSKSSAKSAVAVEHQDLADRAAAQAVKRGWSEHFDRLAELLS